ncbi:unnamed protein product [Notodromas monacha]|uniref:Membrane protein BRI3 n=1 Tax=Notodromas monacha TaxID=399045 RepID=A0A7R9BIK0_9CRUS|nr:unnamed protein product [Notodromas monacha]CAG0916177.1 unnamed protein product [Notodromas monacha]
MKQVPDEDLPPPYEPPPPGFNLGHPTAPPYAGPQAPLQPQYPYAPPNPSIVVVPVTGQNVVQYQTQNGPVTVISGVVSNPISSTGFVFRNLGVCSRCRIGIIQEEFPWITMCCAVFFFPLGLLCLLCTSKKCSHCRFSG